MEWHKERSGARFSNSLVRETYAQTQNLRAFAILEFQISTRIEKYTQIFVRNATSGFKYSHPDYEHVCECLNVQTIL